MTGRMMRRRVWRIARWVIALILAALLALILMAVFALGPGNFGRMFLGVGMTYDKGPPALPEMGARPAVLIFSKTNGFRDDAQIAAANGALQEIARARGWASFTTENAAVFNPAQLSRFRAVVWDSVSGDVLTPEQRKAFRAWIENGGGFVGLHGAGGDPSYAWKWYVDDLIGAQFIGHTMGPQFQRATVIVEDRTHPATRHLDANWVRTDEWYSFAANPRAKGYHILARVDERTYQPLEKLFSFGKPMNIAMGADHPMIWTHCVKNGRVFYSALGHLDTAYSEPAMRTMIGGAIAWAAGLEGVGCRDGQ